MVPWFVAGYFAFAALGVRSTGGGFFDQSKCAWKDRQKKVAQKIENQIFEYKDKA